jgi:hypothetical protein
MHEISKNLIQHSRSPVREFNSGSPKWKTGISTSVLRGSVFGNTPFKLAFATLRRI